MLHYLQPGQAGYGGIRHSSFSRNCTEGESMKSVFCKLALFAALCMSVMSCATTPPSPPPEFKTEIQSEKGSNIATLEAKAVWQRATLLGQGGISGFSIKFTNNTDRIIRVVWEKSSISYNDGSYTLFISGQKYIEASKPMAPSVIPAKGSMEKDVFSSEQPSFTTGQYGGWSMNPIRTSKAVLVLCIESGDIEEYYTVTISY